MPNPLPSARYLRATFRYDPRTGVLTWRRRADAPPNWNARFAGQPAGTATGGRVLVAIKGYKLLRAHRIIWKMVHDQEPPEIDHKDGDPGNNRLSNLRAATRTDNIRNRQIRPGQSGLRGVSRRRGRWAARITLKGRDILIGLFDDPAQAHRAYQRSARQHFGEFAARDHRPVMERNNRTRTEHGRDVLSPAPDSASSKQAALENFVSHPAPIRRMLRVRSRLGTQTD